MANEKAYLLMEALLSLSLLAVGLYAAAESFSRTRDVLVRGSERNQLSICAQEKFVEETIGVSLPSEECMASVTWSAETSALSPSVQKTLWRARWGGNESHEETIEIFRSAN